MRSKIELNNFLAEIKVKEIFDIKTKTNVAVDFIHLNFNDLPSNKFYYLNDYKVFIFKHEDIKGNILFFIKTADTRIKLINILYNDYINYHNELINELFYKEIPDYLQNMILATNDTILNIDQNDLFNRFSDDTNLLDFNINVKLLPYIEYSIDNNNNVSSPNNSNISNNNSAISVLRNPIRIHSNNSSNQSAVNVIRNNYSNSNIWTADDPNIKTINIKSHWSPDPSFIKLNKISKFTNRISNSIVNLKHKFIKN